MGARKFLSGEELQAMLCSHEQALPTVGLKGFAPSDGWLENKEIEAALRDQRQLLEEERVEKRSILSQAKWLPKKNACLLTKVKGRHTQYMGFTEDKQRYLHPEEGLFLLESNELELTFEELPLSIEHAHALLLNENDSLDKYQVYASLSRMGYKVFRHQALAITRYERKINLDQYQLKMKKQVEKGTGNVENLLEVGTKIESQTLPETDAEGEGITLKPVTGMVFKMKAPVAAEESYEFHNRSSLEAQKSSELVMETTEEKKGMAGDKKCQLSADENNAHKMVSGADITNLVEEVTTEGRVAANKSISVINRDACEEIIEMCQDVSEGTTEIRQAVSESSIEVSQTISEDMTEVSQAVSEGTREVSQTISEDKTEVNQDVSEGSSEITHTVREGATEINQDVGEGPTDIITTVNEGTTEINEGVGEGSTEIVHTVSEGTTEVNEDTSEGPTEINQDVIEDPVAIIHAVTEDDETATKSNSEMMAATSSSTKKPRVDGSDARIPVSENSTHIDNNTEANLSETTERGNLRVDGAKEPEIDANEENEILMDEDYERENAMDEEYEYENPMDEDISEVATTKDYEVMDQDNECDVAMDQGSESEVAMDEDSEHEVMDQDNEVVTERSAVTEVVMDEVSQQEIIMSEESEREITADDGVKLCTDEGRGDDTDVAQSEECGSARVKNKLQKLESSKRNEDCIIPAAQNKDSGVAAAESKKPAIAVQNENCQFISENAEKPVSALNQNAKSQICENIEKERGAQRQFEEDPVVLIKSKELKDDFSSNIGNDAGQNKESFSRSKKDNLETTETEEQNDLSEIASAKSDTDSVSNKYDERNEIECLDVEAAKETKENIVHSEITVIEDNSGDWSSDSEVIDVEISKSQISEDKLSISDGIDTATVEVLQGSSIGASEEQEIVDITETSPSKYTADIDVVTVEVVHKSNRSIEDSNVVEVVDVPKAVPKKSITSVKDIDVVTVEGQGTRRKRGSRVSEAAEIVDVEEVTTIKPGTSSEETNVVIVEEPQRPSSKRVRRISEAIEIVDTSTTGASKRGTSSKDISVVAGEEAQGSICKRRKEISEALEVVDMPEESTSKPLTSSEYINVVTVEETTVVDCKRSRSFPKASKEKEKSENAKEVADVEFIQVRGKQDKVVVVDLSDESEDDCTIVEEIGKKEENSWYKKRKDIEIIESSLDKYDAAVIVRSNMLSDLPSMNGEESIFLLPPKDTLLPPNIKLSKPMYNIRKNGIVEDNYVNSQFVLVDEVYPPPPPPLPPRKRPRRFPQQGFQDRVQGFNNRGATNDGCIERPSPGVSPQVIPNDMVFGGSPLYNVSPQPPSLLGASPVFPPSQSYPTSNYYFGNEGLQNFGQRFEGSQSFQSVGQEFQGNQVSQYDTPMNVWDGAPHYNSSRNSTEGAPALGATFNMNNNRNYQPIRQHNNEGSSYTRRYHNRPYNNWRGNSNRGFQKGMFGKLFEFAISLNQMLGIHTPRNFRGGNRPWRKRSWGRYNRRGGGRNYHNRQGGRQRRNNNMDEPPVHRRFQDDDKQESSPSIKEEVKSEKLDVELIIVDDDSFSESHTPIKAEAGSVKSEFQDAGEQSAGVRDSVESGVSLPVVKDEPLGDFIALPKQESDSTEEESSPLPQAPTNVKRGRPGWRRSRRARGRSGVTHWNYYTRKHWGMSIDNEANYVSAVPKIDSEAVNWRSYKRDVEAQKEREALHDGPLSILWSGEVNPLLSPEDGVSPAVMHAKMGVSKSFIPGGRRQLLIVFDVYLPDTVVRRSNPSLPHCRVIIQRSGELLPDSREVSTLLALLDDDVTLLLAINTGGRILYLDLRSVHLPEDDFSSNT